MVITEFSHVRRRLFPGVVVAGIITDQCVSSTVRSLADESFGVLIAEDC